MSIIIGGSCLAAGLIFVGINALMLFRGVARIYSDPVDQLALGVVGAVACLMIPILSIMAEGTFKRSFFGVHRPTIRTLPVIVMWASFVAYNIVTSAGTVASGRQEATADRERRADTTRADQDLRSRLSASLGSIPAHRPLATIEPLLRTERAKPMWGTTKNCTETITKPAQVFCQQISKLEAELASARAADELTMQVQEVSAKLAATGSFEASSDPQVDMLAAVLRIDTKMVRILLSGLTPIILEIGSWGLLHFAFSELGWKAAGRRRADEKKPGDGEAPAGDDRPVAALMSPAAAVEMHFSTTDLAMQRQLAESFFRRCLRPAAGGDLKEVDWYGHYETECRRSHVEPLAVGSFRRIAGQYVPRMAEVDGEWRYFEVLPMHE